VAETPVNDDQLRITVHTLNTIQSKKNNIFLQRYIVTLQHD